MRKKILHILCFIFFAGQLLAQPGFTADDIVKPYLGDFGYGANVGAFPPWRDENLANLAAGNDSLNLPGIGITTFRPELPELFVEFWGYDIRDDAFDHYDDVGMKDHVLFLGTPSPEHRDSTFYCNEHMSKLFKNMYAPIWDNGENGTPYNDTNYYARYVWKVAERYGDHIKFWEVLNEPDLDTGVNAPLAPGQPGNWWDNDPNPCEFHIYAPVEHYVRLLRMTYEIVKTIDPDDYVAVGGFGNPAFLDAVLRNTDNPDDGSITPEYPLNGGAYFDCMSFHSYPHLDGTMRGWDNNTNDFVFFRHSDKALDGLINRRALMENVLFDRGYDGIDKPEKEWILTESNIPRKAFHRGFIGTPMGQRNFLTKALVTIQQYDVRQFHVYSLGDVEPVDSAVFEFELMGLVKNLTGTVPHAYELTESGIAYGSCAKLLKEYRFDQELSDQMHLTETDSIRGCAFKNKDDEVMFVIWAKTYFDNTEYANQNYTFPDSMNIKNFERFSWHFMTTGTSDTILPIDVPLTGEPIFLKANFKPIVVPPTPIDSSRIVIVEPFPVIPDSVSTGTAEQTKQLDLKIFPNPTKEGFNTSFYLKKPDRLTAELFDSKGQRVRQIFKNKKSIPGEIFFFTERENLPDGVYYLKIRGEQFSGTDRVMLY